ncbi:MAG: DegT/DnrJ/EryC1/StrS family aminotransferase [archaeon]
MIPVANTFVSEEDARAVYETVKSGWLSKGKRVAEFEENFSTYTGEKNSITANNGTTALHAVLAALGIKSKDEVLVPTLTFISSANAVLYQNAKPVLVECDPKTFNANAGHFEKKISKKTRAIICVDMNGLPADYGPILELGEKYSIPVIADSAESLGSTYKNKKIGSIAPVHVFSFYPNKNITTGEGGMITTCDDELAEKIRVLINQGQRGRYNHEELGYNYRMNDIQASLGVSQLKQIDKIVSEKQKIADNYFEMFQGKKNVFTPFIPDYATQHAWYMYTLTVDPKKRDKIVQGLAKEGIETRQSFPPIHMQKYYVRQFGYKESDLPVSAKTWRSLINIPIWVGLKKEQQEFIVEKIVGLA